MSEDNKVIIKTVVPPPDRENPPYTRREWYQIGFRDGYKKALDDLENKRKKKMKIDIQSDTKMISN